MITGIILISGIVMAVSIFGCGGLHGEFAKKVQTELGRQAGINGEIITEEHIQSLPAPVQNYLRYTGTVGKNKPRNFRLLFDMELFSKPGTEPMRAPALQYNFYADPARFFYMAGYKSMVPAKGLHSYSKDGASMRVRVAGLFNVVDISGDAMARTETVTVLNDICLYSPSWLVDKRVTWGESDSLTARVFFENGKYKISATLYFNPRGELINFVSDDRGELQDDGSLKKMRWSTPIQGYVEVDGRKVPAYGEAVFHSEKGEFVYGKLKFRGIQYDVAEFQDYP